MPDYRDRYLLSNQSSSRAVLSDRGHQLPAFNLLPLPRSIADSNLSPVSPDNKV